MASANPPLPTGNLSTMFPVYFVNNLSGSDPLPTSPPPGAERGRSWHIPDDGRIPVQMREYRSAVRERDIIVAPHAAASICVERSSLLMRERFFGYDISETFWRREGRAVKRS